MTRETEYVSFDGRDHDEYNSFSLEISKIFLMQHVFLFDTHPVYRVLLEKYVFWCPSPMNFCLKLSSWMVLLVLGFTWQNVRKWSCSCCFVEACLQWTILLPVVLLTDISILTSLSFWNKSESSWYNIK